jgi:hypothetical protein
MISVRSKDGTLKEFRNATRYMKEPKTGTIDLYDINDNRIATLTIQNIRYVEIS